MYFDYTEQDVNESQLLYHVVELVMQVVTTGNTLQIDQVCFRVSFYLVGIPCFTRKLKLVCSLAV